MPGRKTRANNGKGSGSTNGPVETRRVPPVAREPYTEDEARDLLFQGYGDEQVAAMSGFPLAWVRKQPVPQVGRMEKLTGRARRRSA